MHTLKQVVGSPMLQNAQIGPQAMKSRLLKYKDAVVLHFKYGTVQNSLRREMKMAIELEDANVDELDDVLLENWDDRPDVLVVFLFSLKF